MVRRQLRDLRRVDPRRGRTISGVLGGRPAIAANVGATGFVAGGRFSTFLGLAYRRHRIGDIRVGRIALGGAVVAGLISRLVSIAAIGIGSSGIGFGFLAANATWSALFGGLTAGGTVKLAQHSSRSLEDGASTEPGELSAEGDVLLLSGNPDG